MSDPFLGMIIQVGFNFQPQGWQFCNGQLLSIAQNSALFSLLGTTYGGNGTSTFALPDLRGRVAIHQGQGNGLSTYVIGQASGTENITLNQNQMPIHTHTFNGSTSTLQASTTKATVQVPAAGAMLAHTQDLSGKGTTPDIYLPSGSAGSVALGGLNVAGTNSNAGGSQPFSIIQPYLTTNFVIALQGIFPSRN